MEDSWLEHVRLRQGLRSVMSDTDYNDAVQNLIMSQKLTALLGSFPQAVSLREIEDIVSLGKKLDRLLKKQEKNRIDISKLRLFLEELL